MARLENADIIGLFGGSGSGKSYRCRELIKKDKRLIVWDSMAEYDGIVIDGDLLKLMAIITKRKTFKIAFRPSFKDMGAQFGKFCRLVYGVGNLRVVVEELNEVTKPSYAPPEWKAVCSRGRHRGLHVVGLSQRPASVDKDFIGNATEIYAGRLNYDRDWQSLASKFGKDAAKLAKLEKPKQLHWKA